MLRELTKVLYLRMIAKALEDISSKLELIVKLLEAELDIRLGKTKTLEEFLKELSKESQRRWKQLAKKRDL